MTTGVIKIAIIGAAGRMGARLIALAKAEPQLMLVAAIVRAESPLIGKDAGEFAGAGKIDLPLSTDWPQAPDVVIDFSTPESTRHWLPICRQQSIAMLIGTTGLEKTDYEAIDAAAETIAVLPATNTSLGVSVLTQLVSQAARLLDERFDVEIVETHHRFKKDSPSGTALSIADAILAERRRSKGSLKAGRRAGDPPRGSGEIGMHSLRMGDEIGRHTVSFAALGERIEITHAATSRDTFAAGALQAASWLAKQPPGRFSMAEMLANRGESNQA